MLPNNLLIKIYEKIFYRYDHYLEVTASTTKRKAFDVQTRRETQNIRNKEKICS